MQQKIARDNPEQHLTTGTSFEHILEKLLQAGEGSQEPLAEYIRRVSNQSAKQGENVTSNQVLEDIGNDEGAAANTAGSTSSELVFGTPAERFGKPLETELAEMVLSKMVHAATNAGNPANTAINEVSELVEYIRRIACILAKQEV